MKKSKRLLTAFFLVLNFFISFFANAQYSKIYDFSGASGGATPYGPLFYDGTFMYGSTQGGGTNGIGTIFKIRPDGTGFSKLFDFTSRVNGIIPFGPLIYDGTYFYGSTLDGGTKGGGTIFKIKKDGSGFLTFMDSAGYVFYDGTYLFVTTRTGGANNKGDIYKIKPDGTGYFKLIDFVESNGSSWFFDGNFLYGTTAGGMNGFGTIFRLKPDGTSYSKLFDFDSTNGKPGSSLISDGTFLYGTSASVPNNFGRIFKIKTDGTGYLKLFDFTGTNRKVPGSLIFDGAFLYGTTAYGGINDTCGVLFKIKPDGSGFSKLLDFNGANGSGGLAPLILVGNNLYGNTGYGGTNSMGVIYKYTLPTTGITEKTAKSGTKELFTIYPNPNNGKFTIKLEGQHSTYKFDVYNILGELINGITNKTSLTTYDIDISNFPKGIYFIKLFDGENIYSEKVVLE